MITWLTHQLTLTPSTSTVRRALHGEPGGGICQLPLVGVFGLHHRFYLCRFDQRQSQNFNSFRRFGRRDDG